MCQVYYHVFFYLDFTFLYISSISGGIIYKSMDFMALPSAPVAIGTGRCARLVTAILAVAEVVVHRGGGKLGGPWWNFMEIPHVKIWEIPRF